MDLMNAIRNRKSVRAFNSKPIDKAVVKELLQAAIMAPSGSNAQPWKFYVLTGKAREQLDELLASCLDEAFQYQERQVGERSRSHRNEFTTALFRLLSMHNITTNQLFQNLLGYYHAPVIIMITVDDLVRENTLATGAAVENLLLAAEDRGLGACWITFPFMRTKSGGQRIKRHLKIPANEKLISSIALGYPDEQSALNSFKSSRGNIDSFVEWVGWE